MLINNSYLHKSLFVLCLDNQVFARIGNFEQNQSLTADYSCPKTTKSTKENHKCYERHPHLTVYTRLKMWLLNKFKTCSVKASLRQQRQHSSSLNIIEFRANHMHSLSLAPSCNDYRQNARAW